MSPAVDHVAIAGRLRGLLVAPNSVSLDTAARRLGVPEEMLRASLDERAPHQTLEVLAAVVREYGIDPTWLLRGEYDLATHCASLEDENLTPPALLDLVAPAERLPPEEVYEIRVELPVAIEPTMNDALPRSGDDVQTTLAARDTDARERSESTTT